MATTDRPGFFSFAQLSTPPEPQGAYQTAATLMKIKGWLSVVSVAITALVGLVGIAMLLFAGAVATFLGGLLPIPFGQFSGLGVALVALVLIVVILVILAIALAFLYWISWIYAKWTVHDPRALQHLKVFAIVVIVFSGLGVLGGIGSLSPGVLLDIANLVIGILMLVQANDASLQQHFQHAGSGFRPVPR